MFIIEYEQKCTYLMRNLFQILKEVRGLLIIEIRNINIKIKLS